jgi:hypothetical protein
MNNTLLYNPNIINGIRILVANAPDYDKYYIHYEFTDSNWKESAKKILIKLSGKDNISIQTSHPYTCSDISSNILSNNNIWVYNDSIFYCDL